MAGGSTPLPATPRIPATMLVAPNSAKQPTITVTPRRTSIRPLSNKNPTAATAMTARYFFGPGVDEPVLWDGGGMDCSQSRFLHPDAQGSIVAVANCWGGPIATNSYDEYGIPAATNIGRFQYTGQIWLPDLGMYYYKARMYSPSLGRFMQTDPIGYADQNNLYAYVGNDPMDGRDPSGTTCVTSHKAIQCKIDSVVSDGVKRAATDADRHKYGRVEASLTQAASAAINAKGSVTINMNGSSFSVSSASVANNLFKSEAVVDPSNTNGYMNAPKGQIVIGKIGLDPWGPKYPSSVEQDISRQRAALFLHEGIHNTPEEAAALAKGIIPDLGSGPGRLGHQNGYAAAAEELLRLGGGQ